MKTFEEFINENADLPDFIQILQPDLEKDRKLYMLNNSYTYDDWKNMVYELLKVSYYDHDVFGRDGKGGIKNIEWFARCVDYLFEVYCKVKGWDVEDDDCESYFSCTDGPIIHDPQPTDNYECYLSDTNDEYGSISAFRIDGTFTVEIDRKRVSVTGYDNVIR